METKLLLGDCVERMRELPDQSVNCCVTSPPYFGLRDYGMDGQIGLEDTPEAFVARLVEVFREVRRVLRDDGTLWLNLGDSYARQAGNDRSKETDSGLKTGRTGKSDQLFRDGCNTPPDGLKPKDLIGIPWRVAFALQADGWYLRQDIIWHKPNPMPESVKDRCTKAHEYVFLLSKSQKYYFDNTAIMEPAIYGQQHANKATSWGTDRKHPNKANTADYAFKGDNSTCYKDDDGNYMKNRRSVWTVATKPYKGAHFATYPPELIRPCIQAGCPPQGRRCDCNEIINTPTGSGEINDPSLIVGRAGMSRERRDNEGARAITRRTQRHHAQQIKDSHHRDEIASMCGSAFDHYIRTDKSGARPLPQPILEELLLRGWITMPTGDCECPVEPAGTVLDPFGGSGTTAQVALEEGRNAIICELNPEYLALAETRITAAKTRIIQQDIDDLL